MMIIDRFAYWWLDWRMTRRAQNDPAFKDLGFEKFEVKPGFLELSFATEAVGVLAEQASVFLEQNGATNFVQFDMMPRLDRGIRPIRVTVQWADGLSPATKCAMLEAKVKRLEAEIDELKPMAEYGENLASEFP